MRSANYRLAKGYFYLEVIYGDIDSTIKSNLKFSLH